jgi:hypothetical protein
MPDREALTRESAHGLRVMAIKPGWRYAVIFEHHTGELATEPAMPFYTRRGAMAFARKMGAEMTECRMYVFRKRRWRWREVDDEPVAILPRVATRNG